MTSSRHRARSPASSALAARRNLASRILSRARHRASSRHRASLAQARIFASRWRRQRLDVDAATRASRRQSTRVARHRGRRRAHDISGSISSSGMRWHRGRRVSLTWRAAYQLRGIIIMVALVSRVANLARHSSGIAASHQARGAAASLNIARRIALLSSLTSSCPLCLPHTLSHGFCTDHYAHALRTSHLHSSLPHSLHTSHALFARTLHLFSAHASRTSHLRFASSVHAHAHLSCTSLPRICAHATPLFSFAPHARHHLAPTSHSSFTRTHST